MPTNLPPVKPKVNGAQLGVELEQQRNYQKHCERLAAIQPRVDNSVPYSTTAAVGTYSKRQKMMEENQRDIDKENARLVQSMVRIMDNGSRVDNKRPPKGITTSRQRQMQREQKRIEEENWKMLQRLESARPTYSSEKWTQDSDKNQLYAARRTRYPYRSFKSMKRTQYGDGDEYGDGEEDASMASYGNSTGTKAAADFKF